VDDRLRWDIPKDEVFRLKRELELRESEAMNASNDASIGASVHPPERYARRAPSLYSGPGSEPMSEATHGPMNTSAVNTAPLNTAEAVPLSAHLAALELARLEIERLHQQVDRTQAEARADLAEERRRTEYAERTREQAERARMALEFQLQKYQGALSEHADSLAQERALRLAAEAQAAEARLTQSQTPPAPEPANEVAPAPEPLAEPIPGSITKPRKTFGQRVRGWFGMSQAN
jgi:hypothetical protein